MKSLMKIAKKITKNPRIILAYLNAIGLFNFLPSKLVLRILWWVKTGEKLNLSNPKTFSEKIQWIKLNYRDPKLTILVDKFKVREYIKDTIGDEYLIPLLGVWKNAKNIDFDNLPDKFVLKCNHNAAIGLTICRDKSRLNIKKTKQMLNKGLSRNFYYSSREWAYKNVERRIICEKYIEDIKGESLRDYKFFCFSGSAKFIYVSEGLENHDSAKISFYSLNGEEMPFQRNDYKNFTERPRFPENLKDMIEIANRLATGIDVPFVRVDLYSVDSKIYFSELTFYPNSGYIPFDPIEWDGIIGEWLTIPEIE